jgi:hypothetical protein
MEEKVNDRKSDLTKSSSERAGQSAWITLNQESDSVNGNSGLGNVSTPDGDSAAENKIATSLADD